MLFFRQMDWKEFSNQPHIKKLSINEQMQQFSYHLSQMSNLNKFQPKGNSTLSPSTTPTPSPTPTLSPTPTPSPTPTGSLVPMNFQIIHSLQAEPDGDDVQFQVVYSGANNAPGLTCSSVITPADRSFSLDVLEGGTASFQIKKFSPNNVAARDGNITVTATGTYSSINPPPGKSNNYTYTTGTVIDHSVDEPAWTWTITGVSSDTVFTFNLNNF